MNWQVNPDSALTHPAKHQTTMAFIQWPTRCWDVKVLGIGAGIGKFLFDDRHCGNPWTIEPMDLSLALRLSTKWNLSPETRPWEVSQDLLRKGQEFFWGGRLGFRLYLLDQPCPCPPNETSGFATHPWHVPRDLLWIWGRDQYSAMDRIGLTILTLPLCSQWNVRLRHSALRCCARCSLQWLILILIQVTIFN